MALIVVCEDDATTRELICAVLEKAGHQVEAFDNGLKGYVRLLEGDAELLISDVQMPGKDGFALVADVRADKALMEMPCILLTSLQERAHMRIGMTSGADDYVTKPFLPSELLDAVNIQLKRAMDLFVLHFDETQKQIDVAVSERIQHVIAEYEVRLRKELQLRWSRSDTASANLQGSMLICGIANQETWLAQINDVQMADVARHFFSKVADSAALFSAEHVQFIGEGLLIVFDGKADTPSVQHAGRAQRFVRSMEMIKSSMQAYVRDHLQQVLPFDYRLAVHEGRMSLGKLDGVTGGIEQLLPVGQDVQTLIKLLKAAQSLDWDVLFSPDAVAHWEKMGLQQIYAGFRNVKIGELGLRLYQGR
jgi:DNA-binding response OmpR family regulator